MIDAKTSEGYLNSGLTVGAPIVQRKNNAARPKVRAWCHTRGASDKNYPYNPIWQLRGYAI